MQRARVPHPDYPFGPSRIYTRCHTLSATGRISLHEPNIQNIPRFVELCKYFSFECLNAFCFRDFDVGGKAVKDAWREGDDEEIFLKSVSDLLVSQHTVYFLDHHRVRLDTIDIW